MNTKLVSNVCNIASIGIQTSLNCMAFTSALWVDSTLLFGFLFFLATWFGSRGVPSFWLLVLLGYLVWF